jgi:hypothetical protein
MFKLTYIVNGTIKQVTSPSYWALYHIRVATSGSRLWNKDGSLSF